MLGKYILLISISIFFATGEVLPSLNLESRNEKGYTIYQPIYISPILQALDGQGESTPIEKPTEEKLEDILTRWKIRVDNQLSTMETNITENINYNISVRINSLERTIRDQFEKLNEVIANKSFEPHKTSKATEVKPHVQPGNTELTTETDELNIGSRSTTAKDAVIYELPTPRTTQSEWPFEGYKTAYACEWKTLEVACESGTVINVIWANYGRLALSKCNDSGKTNWNTNCKTSDSILNDRCHMQRSCSVSASNGNFGDPCVGTEKYLELHYQCIPVFDYI